MLYYRAARTLLQLHQQAESPLYFLFVHTIALAFKAYLRSRGIVTPRGQRGHALRDLLEQCHRNGLQVDLDLRNVVQLLESENSRHGFRYFVFEGTGRPDINYLREVVNELMRVIEEVIKRPTTGLSSVVLKFIVDRPQKK
jgi:HEPN domain-containing protein